jgi:hypothetical protein
MRRVRHAADFEQLEAPLEELALQEEPSLVPIETFIAADCSTPENSGAAPNFRYKSGALDD